MRFFFNFAKKSLTMDRRPKKPAHRRTSSQPLVGWVSPHHPGIYLPLPDVFLFPPSNTHTHSLDGKCTSFLLFHSVCSLTPRCFQFEHRVLCFQPFICAPLKINVCRKSSFFKYISLISICFIFVPFIISNYFCWYHNTL